MTAQVVRAGRIVATVNRAISRGTTTGQPVLRRIRVTASPAGWRRRSPSGGAGEQGYEAVGSRVRPGEGLDAADSREHPVKRHYLLEEACLGASADLRIRTGPTAAPWPRARSGRRRPWPRPVPRAEGRPRQACLISITERPYPWIPVSGTGGEFLYQSIGAPCSLVSARSVRLARRTAFFLLITISPSISTVDGMETKNPTGTVQIDDTAVRCRGAAAPGARRTPAAGPGAGPAGRRVLGLSRRATCSRWSSARSS